MLRRLSISLAACAAAVTAAAPAYAWQVTWLGHAGFVVEAKNGTRVLIDPWLKNPKFPKDYTLPGHVDAILVTHGHFDHAGSAAELSTRYKAPIIGCFELASQLAPKGGTEPIGANVGGTVTIKGLRISLIPAVHSSGISGENDSVSYGGTPVGFVLASAGERTLMHAGDTGVTREYDLVRELYHPAIALLPIGGHFTMDPPQAAIAARLLGVTDVVPMHYGTFGALSGTPAQLRQALGHTAKVTELTPGKTTKL